jgi:lipoprotein-releasing system ATP-binding protein
VKAVDPVHAEAPLPRKKETVLSCAGLHRYLGQGEGRVHALQGVSLDIRAGKTYAIVGASGCGKSTLLYTLGLLDRPDAGTICLQGRDLSRADDEQRTRARLDGIGFVFQFHFLLAEFTALENVMLPMIRLGKLSPEERRDRAAGLLRQVGLAGKAGRLANRLSGGEQQRVAVARALANSPSLLLADEPTGNLDAGNAERVVDLLVGLAEAQERAVVIVTHNEAIAKRCDHELLMKDGAFV